MGNLTHTVSGDIASFKSAARVPVTNCKFGFKPKQDLHGYSKPWPAGGGKNLFNKDDSTSIVTGLNIDIIDNIRQLTGSSKATFIYIPCQPNTTYTASKIATARSAIGYVITQPPFSSGNIIYGYVNFNNATSATTTTGNDATYLIVYINNGAYDDTPLQNILDSLQIEIGSSATSYEPYSNICPIEGWTGLEGSYSGKNMGTIQQVLSDRPYTEVTEDGRECVYVKAAGTNGINNSSEPISFVGAFKENTQYTISVWAKQVKNPDASTDPASPFRIYFDYTNGTTGTMDLWPNVSGTSRLNEWRLYTATSTSGKTIRQLRLGSYEYRLFVYFDKNTFQLEEGAAATTYEPYIGARIPVTFPVVGKNIVDIDTFICKSNLEKVNDVFQNTIADTRNSLQFYIQYWKTTSTYIQNSSSVLYNVQTGFNSITFTVNDPDCHYIAFKHNGSSKDFVLLIPFNYPLGTYTISCNVLANDPTTIGGVQWENIQIEYGDTATAYEPYSSNNTVYGGYVDVAAGEIVATYAKYTLTGVEGWTVDGSGNTSRRAYTDTARVGEIAKASGKLYCNYCHNSSGIWRGWVSSTGYASSCHILFYIPVSLDTSAKWTEYLSNNPLEVCYELNVPIHYPISKAQLKTLLNQNNFWANTNDSTSISYTIHDSAPMRAARARIATNEPHIATASGAIANFNTDMKAPIVSCKAYFTPMQGGSGDPSPENIRTIYGWNGLNLWHIQNNMFKLNLPESIPDNTDNAPSNKRKYEFNTVVKGIASTNDYIYKRINYFSLTDNMLSFNADVNQNYGVGYPVKLPLGTYYLSSTNNCRRICILHYDIEGTYISRVDQSTDLNGFSFTISDSQIVQSIIIFLGNANITTNVSNVILTQLSNQTYNNYNVSNMSITWTSTAGTIYGGYVDFVKGTLVQTHNKIIDSGSTGWSVDQSGDVNRALASVTTLGGLPPKTKYHADCMFNYIKTTPSVQSINWTGAINEYGNIALRIPAEYDTYQKWKAYLNEHPLEIVYELATPIEYQLTPTQLKSFLGTNNIWSNANGNTTVEYWTH